MTRFEARLWAILESEFSLNRQKRADYTNSVPPHYQPVQTDMVVKGEIIKLSDDLAARFGGDFAIDFAGGNEGAASQVAGANLWKYRVGKNGQAIGLPPNAEIYVEPATSEVYVRVSRRMAGHTPRTGDRGGLVIKRGRRIYYPLRVLDGEAKNRILALVIGGGDIDWRPTESLPEDFYAA